MYIYNINRQINKLLLNIKCIDAFRGTKRIDTHLYIRISTSSRAVLFCSFQAVTSSVIYLSTQALKRNLFVK